MNKQSSSRRVEKAIWVYRLKEWKPRIIAISGVAIILLVALLPHLTIGDSSKVNAKVISIGVNQGVDGVKNYLVCELESGKVVNASLLKGQLINVGDNIVLLEEKRLLGFLDNRYSFFKKYNIKE